MVKKVLTGLVLSGILLGLAWSVLAQSPIPDHCIMKRDPGIPECKYVLDKECFYATEQICGLCCLISTIYYAADWVFTFLVIIVILFVLWGASDILQAAGEPEKMNKGRNRIIYAALGLAIALLAKAVPAVVKFILVPK